MASNVLKLQKCAVYSLSKRAWRDSLMHLSCVTHVSHDVKTSEGLRGVSLLVVAFLALNTSVLCHYI